jgi:SAM-dependent methyltransferase
MAAALRARFPTHILNKKVIAAAGATTLAFGVLNLYPAAYDWTWAQLETLRARRAAYMLGQQKRTLFRSLQQGRVIEIGAGAGANFASFPNDCQITYTAVESNKFAAPALRQSAGTAGFPAPILDVQTSDVLKYLKSQPSNSVDAVICTGFLARIPRADVPTVVTQINRVLRPHGRFYFVEQVASSNFLIRGLQHLVNPAYRLLSLGNRLTNNTDEVIRGCTGFSKIVSEPWTFSRTASTSTGSSALSLRPIVAGIAVKKVPSNITSSSNPLETEDPVETTRTMGSLLLAEQQFNPYAYGGTFKQQQATQQEQQTAADEQVDDSNSVEEDDDDEGDEAH